MDYKILFSKEGKLKIFYEKKDQFELIDLHKLQQEFNQNDSEFWSYWSNKKTIFEPGTTIRSFMLCLEPWKDFFSKKLRIDLNSYLKEVKKSLFKVVKKENSNIIPFKHNEQTIDLEIQNQTFDWIELAHFLELTPQINYEHIDSSKFELFMKAKKQLTGKWEFNDFYSLTGFHKNDSDTYSVEGLSLIKIANVPLFLKQDSFLMIDNFYIKNKQLLNSDCHGVYFEEKNCYQNLIIDKEHIFKHVLNGFFKWFQFSPIERDEETAKLQQLFNKVENDFKINDEKKDNNTIIHLKSNIINQQADSNIEQNNHSDSQENKKLDIKILPGAFDSVYESLIEERNMWENWKNKVTFESIQTIGEHTPPEYRMYKKILSESEKPKLSDWF